MTDHPAEALARTALYELHLELGARMMPFAGYAMPMQYPDGILKEHLHTRSQAGLFDVSHMGQVRLTGVDAATALESLMPVDIVDLPKGQQRYALFTNEAGGVLDDLMVANLGNALYLVVNAACRDQDVAHLRTHIGKRCEVELITDRAVLALQGPAAAQVLARLAPQTARLVFMEVALVELCGADCLVSRSGYTGEDGFEISVPSNAAQRLARELLQQPEVTPIGLGARDTLRLEAGLCLYGHDLDTATTPVESGLLWALSRARRHDGARPGGYPGADRILAQLRADVERKRVGLLPQGRVPVREGAELLDKNGLRVGHVTSGGFGPTLNAPVAMGYVCTELAQPGTVLQAIVRGKAVSLEVTKLPFVAQHYYRG